MQIGRHFQLNEFTGSQAAARHGVSNIPDAAVLDSLRALCANVLDPLREQLGRPIVITSGYRAPEVNRLVGGSRSSQHCLGEAADFKVPGLTPVQVFDFVRGSDLPFDQLILEFNQWTHISYSQNQRRGQCLIARHTAQGVRYESVARGPVAISIPPAATPALQPQKTQEGPFPAHSAPVPAPVISAPNDEFGTLTVGQQPTLGQRLGSWVDSMDVSRLIGVLSFIATATTGLSTMLGDLNPKYAAYALTISATINAFTKKVTGEK